ncbi:hypothetical protein MKX01_040035 [Papaver californicum]|nr:hypothetical protein MKX01_040035 [Papaver californicum]
MDEYYYFPAEQRNLSGDICSSVQDAYAEVAEETLELIHEAVEKLNSVRCSTLTDGGSSLGNITLWNVLFETSLVNLRFDLICKKHAETINLGVKLLVSVKNRKFCQTYLNQLHASIERLLTIGEGILVEFLAIHRTVAEIDEHSDFNMAPFDIFGSNCSISCILPVWFGGHFQCFCLIL